MRLQPKSKELLLQKARVGKEMSDLKEGKMSVVIPTLHSFDDDGNANTEKSEESTPNSNQTMCWYLDCLFSSSPSSDPLLDTCQGSHNKSKLFHHAYNAREQWNH